MLQRSSCLVMRSMLGSFETLFKFVNTPAAIDELLLARKKGMALRADVDADQAALCGAGFGFFTACTAYSYFVIRRMNSVLHVFCLLLSDVFHNTKEL